MKKRKTMNFTKTNLKGLPVSSTRKNYYDNKVPQLGITVFPSGKKFFHVKATIEGTTRRISIENGESPKMSPEVARAQAIALFAEIGKGINPAQKRRDKRVQKAAEAIAAVTLREVLDLYLKRRKLKSEADYRRRIEQDFGEPKKKEGFPDKNYLDMPMTDITETVIKKTNDNRQGRAGPALRIMKGLFSFAMTEYPEVFDHNPVDIIRKQKSGHKYKRRVTYIKPEELLPWFNAVEQQEPMYKEYFLFLLLTGVRSDSEGASLSWEDINWRAKTFMLRDTKNGRDIELPLPEYLIPLLNKRKGTGAVFPITNYARFQREEISNASDVRFSRHDLRRTFLSIGESLDISYLTVKRLANHADSVNDVTAGYIPVNLDRMRAASKKIEAFILTKANRLNAEVTAIHA